MQAGTNLFTAAVPYLGFSILPSLKLEYYSADTVLRDVRGGHHGPEPANRHPHRLRAGQEPEAGGFHAVLGR